MNPENEKGMKREKVEEKKEGEDRDWKMDSVSVLVISFPKQLKPNEEMHSQKDQGKLGCLEKKVRS